MTWYRLQEGNLFEDLDLDWLARAPIRPLGRVSDFVVEELPRELERIRGGGSVQEFSDRIEALLGFYCRDAGTIVSPLTPHEKPLALLDAHLLQSAVINAGGQPGKRLHALTAGLSERLGTPNILTYGDIVITNPPEDMRTFTPGRIGHAEASFYAAHQQIEGELGFLITFLQQAGKGFDAGNPQQANQNMEEATTALSSCTEVMGRFQGLPPDYYEVFRTYLKEHSNLHGPSAFYSPGVALMDVLYAGTRLPQDYLEQLETDLRQGYFCRRDDIQNAVENAREKHAILDQVEQRDEPDSYSSALDFTEGVLDFRRVHYRAAKAAVPDVVRDECPGTSGETLPGTLLRSRMAAYRSIITSLTERVPTISR